MIQLPPPPAAPHLLDDAIGLLKSDIQRNFAIDIETDSTIQPDEQMEQESRIEALTAISTFLANAGPIVQTQPQLAPVIGEALLFMTRTFKSARQLESTIEGMVEEVRNNPPQPQPDPAQQKAQAEIELEKARLQMDGEKAKQDAQIKQAELQQKGQLAEREMQIKTGQAQQEMALKERQIAMEMQLKQMQAQNDMSLKRETSQNDMAVKRETAKKPAATVNLTSEGQFSELKDGLAQSTQAVQQTMQAVVKGQADVARLLADAAKTIAQAAEQMSRPRRTRAIRDENGSLIEAVSEVA